MHKKTSVHIKSPHTIVREPLSDNNSDLTCFYFRYGANVYVFSYLKEGVIKHTFIDTGDTSYRNQIIPALIENNINPDHIENVIITHRHHDHCALADILVNKSGGRILAHRNFRGFVEDEMGAEERRWLGDFDPSRLKECNIEYLPHPDRNRSVTIGGVEFPSMIDPIDIGGAGTLEVLGCPESTPTHSPDQLIARYTPNSNTNSNADAPKSIRLNDEILFSGDLWLMTGPIFNKNLRHLSLRFRFGLKQIKAAVSGKGTFSRDPRIQDAAAKEALKGGFSLITVKPGHGEEFLGSRILPDSLLADRDLLFKLGYSMDMEKSILRSGELAPKVSEIREASYAAFAKALLLWRDLGYSLKEISELLARIYKEQSGGGPLVEEDRKERRERMHETLTRLRDDKEMSDNLHDIAKITLSELQNMV